MGSRHGYKEIRADGKIYQTNSRFDLNDFANTMWKS